MESNKENSPLVISIISGKGGAGKTSVGLGMAYLLQDMGLSILVIDVDLYTNGCSYFFRYKMSQGVDDYGIIEFLDYLVARENKSTDYIQKNIGMIKTIKLKDNLQFIPSKVNFSKKHSFEEEIYFKKETISTLLKSLIDSIKKDFDIIFLDSPAGSNIISSITSYLSQKALIVSEFDSVSSDAVENLLIQIGDKLPDYKKHLINKVYIQESKEYKSLSILFDSFNRLPPLPFDFEVRAAFANRTVPVDVNKPTTFLISIFNATKAFLPEYQKYFEEYESKIQNLYQKYQNELSELMDKRREIASKLYVDRHSNRQKGAGSFVAGVFSLIGAVIFSSIISSITFDFNFWETLWKFVYNPIVFSIIFLFVLIGTISIVTEKKRKKKLQVDEVERDQLIKLQTDIDDKIKNYESHLFAKSKDFFINE